MRGNLRGIPLLAYAIGALALQVRRSSQDRPAIAETVSFGLIGAEIFLTRQTVTVAARGRPRMYVDLCTIGPPRDAGLHQHHARLLICWIFGLLLTCI